MQNLPIVQKYIENFKNLKGDKKKIALGLAVGVFVGMTPFIGLQIFIAIFLAQILKGNKVAAGIGVFNTNFFTAPIFFAATYAVGALLLGLNDIFLFSTFSEMDSLMSFYTMGGSMMIALTIGGILVGIPMGIATYYIALRVMNRYALQRVHA